MILAIDTSTGTSVALLESDGTPILERLEPSPRGHAEAIGGLLSELLVEAGIGPTAIELVAVGMGPGPYTGLRVGIAAAEAFALGRGIPRHGVASHAAARRQLGLPASTPLATLAGRRGH